MKRHYNPKSTGLDILGNRMVGFGKTRGNLTEMFVKMNFSEIDKERT
jgi:hypothetical protein